MNCILTRKQVRPDGVFGELRDEDGRLLAITLEHAFGDDESGYAAKVPVGTYACIKRESPRFGFPVFMLTDVPGHDFIEIHPGNWNKDSDGCILLGEGIATDSNPQMITNSRAAFSKFMEIQDACESFQLIVA